MTRKITKTALRRIYAEAEPLCQLDLFCDRAGVVVARGSSVEPIGWPRRRASEFAR